MKFVYNESKDEYSSILDRRLDSILSGHVLKMSTAKSLQLYEACAKKGYGSVLLGFGEGAYRNYEFNRRYFMMQVLQSLNSGEEKSISVILLGDEMLTNDMHAVVCELIKNKDAAVKNIKGCIIDLRESIPVVTGLNKGLAANIRSIKNLILDAVCTKNEAGDAQLKAKYTVKDFMDENSINLESIKKIWSPGDLNEDNYLLSLKQVKPSDREMEKIIRVMNGGSGERRYKEDPVPDAGSKAGTGEKACDVDKTIKDYCEERNLCAFTDSLDESSVEEHEEKRAYIEEKQKVYNEDKEKALDERKKREKSPSRPEPDEKIMHDGKRVVGRSEWDLMIRMFGLESTQRQFILGTTYIGKKAIAEYREKHSAEDKAEAEDGGSLTEGGAESENSSKKEIEAENSGNEAENSSEKETEAESSDNESERSIEAVKSSTDNESENNESKEDTTEESSDNKSELGRSIEEVDDSTDNESDNSESNADASNNGCLPDTDKASTGRKRRIRTTSVLNRVIFKWNKEENKAVAVEYVVYNTVTKEYKKLTKNEALMFLGTESVTGLILNSSGNEITVDMDEVYRKQKFKTAGQAAYKRMSPLVKTIWIELNSKGYCIYSISKRVSFKAYMVDDRLYLYGNSDGSDDNMIDILEKESGRVTDKAIMDSFMRHGYLKLK